MIARLTQFIVLSIVCFQLSAQCAADICAEAEILFTETPVDCLAGETMKAHNGCLAATATSEDTYIACMNDQTPTVWYKIEIDSDQAVVLSTQVDAVGFDPQWSVWQSVDGTCEGMIEVGCSGADNVGQNLIVPVIQNEPGVPSSYWVAISAFGDIDNTEFTLNYASSLNCISCSGDNPFDCDNGEFTAYINGDVVPLEDYQNFPPGQQVEVCFSFNYNTTGTGNDWLHGIIPTFGNGWDLEESNLENINFAGGWEWYDAEGECATTTSIYDLPNLCTYIENETLKLCNTACDPTCPCDGPLFADSPLPSAWFWNSSGGSTTCDDLSCKPIHSYGVPSGVNVDIDACLNLKVKILGDENGDGIRDCFGKNDLRISFQTTSDAITGCWEDSPCLLDPSIMGPNWEVNCGAQVIPTVVFVDEEEDGVYDGDEVILDGYSLDINSGEGQVDISSSQKLVLTEGENSVELLLDELDFELTTNLLTYNIELSRDYYNDTLVWGVKPLNVNVESINENEISILPNPTTDVVNVEYVGQNFDVELYSVTGQFISKESTTSGFVSIDMESLEYGIYIIKIIDNDLLKNTTVKVVRL